MLTTLGEPLGRITFELFKDVTPKTAENFRQFCTGESKNSAGRPQGYKGSKFHRIVCSLHDPARPSFSFAIVFNAGSCAVARQPQYAIRKDKDKDATAHGAPS